MSSSARFRLALYGAAFVVLVFLMLRGAIDGTWGSVAFAAGTALIFVPLIWLTHRQAMTPRGLVDRPAQIVGAVVLVVIVAALLLLRAFAPS